MSYMRLINSLKDDFAHAVAGKNVLILHPQFRYHNALIEEVLSASPGETLYLSLSDTCTDLVSLWQVLGKGLEELGLKLPALDASPSVSAKSFVEALSSIGQLMVVLAAYDKADNSVHEFVSAVAESGASNLTLVIDGRSWPEMLVDRLNGSENTALLPVSPDDMLLDYLARDESKVLVEVRALGAGQVLINGRQIDQWDGALPRALFFYFVDRGMTTRDEVFSTFWPELSTREATNVFHVTKRKISEILQVDLTVYSSGFYRIAPHVDLRYDVVSFGEAVQNSAVAEADEAEVLLRRAIGLHERDFLREFDQPWAVRRREELRRTYVDALTALARLYEDRGMQIEALGLYNRAFGAFPQREDLARAQMRLYQESGQTKRALAVFDCLVHELNVSLGVAPASETIELADEVRATV